MRNCSTCCTRTKTFDFGIPATRPDEKLEFVEHVLGVLIESRYGVDNPYTRLGERTVAIGHSQMFANVTLLNAAENAVVISTINAAVEARGTGILGALRKGLG